MDESLKEKRSGVGDAAGTKNARKDRDSLLGLMGAAIIYNWCNDKDRTAQFISEGSLEVTGYPPETLTNPAGTSYGQLIEPEDRDRVWEEIQAALEAAREFRIVYRIRTADQTTKWVWEQGSGIYSPNGEVLFLRGLILDISNQVEAIFTYDREGRFISVNREACERIGYAEEELLGRNIFEVGILKGRALEAASVGFKWLMNIGRTLRSDLELVTRDRSTIIADTTAAPLLNEAGEAVAATNIALDMTERKMAEEALRRSEEELRVTFESTGTAMGILRHDGILTRINHEMEKLLGYAREEIEGKRKYSEFIAEESRDLVADYSRKLLSGELSGAVQFECTLVSKSGDRVEAIVNSSILPGMNKSVFSVIDITEKKKDERLLEERAEQLRNFLDVAAHELRHPATLLKGYAFTLNKRWETMDTETRSEALNAMDAGVNRLEGVVEELLDMSRIQRGRFAILKKNVEIKPLIERAVREMKDRGNDNAIGIKMKKGTGFTEVDSDAFMRLLIILLDNAVKYSSESSPIEIIAEVRGQGLVVSVLDRGVGIPDDARDKIFDRFYQVEDPLHQGISGLGLGLFIASCIAEAHGGRLEYEPRKGGGSIFTFSL